MKHPSEAELALYAGGDLGWWKQSWARRHVLACEACLGSVSGFSKLRSDAAAVPSLPWARLQSEMAANIRLGLAAGECVGKSRLRAPRSLRRSWDAGAWRRLGVACAVLVGVAGIGYVVQHPPAPGGVSSGPSAPGAGSVLEASENGLQVHDGAQTLRLLNTSGKEVSHSVGSRGELGARYLDPNGNVTISQVYGQ